MADENEADTGSDTGAAEVQARARTQGWRPQEEFKGDPNDWVDADTYLSRIDENAPVMRERMKTLERQNRTLTRELAAQRKETAEMREIMEEVRVWSSKSAENAYNDARERVQREMEEAFEAGDKERHAKALKRAIKLDEERDTKSDAVDDDKGRKPAPKKPAAAPQVDPDIEDWVSAPEQAWFRSSQEMGQWAQAQYSIQQRKLGAEATTVEILDAVRKRATQVYPEMFENERPRGGKQQVLDPSERNGGGGGGKKKTPTKIDDLPSEDRAEARKVFDRFKRGMPEYKEEDYVAEYMRNNRR